MPKSTTGSRESSTTVIPAMNGRGIQLRNSMCPEEWRCIACQEQQALPGQEVKLGQARRIASAVLSSVDVSSPGREPFTV